MNPAIGPLRRPYLRWLPWLLLALTAAGCSFTRLAYDHAGWLARHYVAGFVDLDSAQQQDFDRAFADLWRWHRRTQLPEYAAFARELSTNAGTAQTAAEVGARAQRSEALARVLAGRLLQDAAPLLSQLRDAQVERMLLEIDRRIAKSAKRAAKLGEDEWREEQIEKTGRSLEKYAGALEPGQRDRIRVWAGGLERDPERTRAAAQAWRDQFAGLLRQRHEPDFDARLQSLLDPQGPEIQAASRRREAANQRYIALLAELSSRCTSRQRQHLRNSLNALAGDLEALAAEPDSEP